MENINRDDVIGWLYKPPPPNNHKAVYCTACARQVFDEQPREAPRFSPIFGDADVINTLKCVHCQQPLIFQFARGVQAEARELGGEVSKLEEEAEAAAEQAAFDDQERVNAVARFLHDRDGHRYAPSNCPDCEHLKGELEL